MNRMVSSSVEYTLADQERMQLATNYFEWQARLAAAEAGRRVIEIGCGIGNFTRHLLNRDLVAGIDVAQDCIDRLIERFPNQPNLIALRMDVQDSEFLRLKRYQPDSIVCLNVLEHVRDDRQALEHMRVVLAPTGRAIFIVPAFESLYGPIDAKLGHFRRYSKRSWRALVETTGFHLRVMRYMNSAGFAGWWLNAKVLKKTEQSAGQVAIFDSLIVPVLSRLEHWIEPPFGQSLFSVIEKVGA